MAGSRVDSTGVSYLVSVLSLSLLIQLIELFSFFFFPFQSHPPPPPLCPSQHAQLSLFPSAQATGAVSTCFQSCLAVESSNLERQPPQGREEEENGCLRISQEISLEEKQIQIDRYIYMHSQFLLQLKKLFFFPKCKIFCGKEIDFSELAVCQLPKVKINKY